MYGQQKVFKIQKSDKLLWKMKITVDSPFIVPDLSKIINLTHGIHEHILLEDLST
jgi:hypothetical protein